MAKQIDAYRDWLGIPDAERPLTHYQLLRLTRFEDDPARIRLHYRKMNAHVRKFATGDYAQQSQDLLNELAKAMLCLTDTRRKGEYDASLGREEATKRRKHTLEEILVGRKIIDMPQLEKARNLAKAIGLEIRDAVMQQKLAAADAVMQAYAESLGLPYLDLGDVGVSEALAPKVPAVLARQHSCVPVMVDNGQLLMASPNPIIPEVEEELRLRMGMPVRSVLCTPADINAAVAKYYPKEVAAAQLAAGTAAPAPASVASAAGKAAPSAAAAPLSAEERTELKKRRQMIAIVAANLTFFATVIFGNLAPKMAKSFGLSGSLKLYGAALVLALVMAGVGWVVGGFLKR